MKTRVTLQLLEEIRTFRLRYACDDCSHFDPAQERCAHGYPHGERRRALSLGEDIAFCKEFEG